MTNLVSSRAIDNGCELIEKLFEQAFFSSYQTVLKGGAEEPLYQPSEKKSVPHTIYYREDYLASALHEVAHWCLAGEVRRQQLDFGYWYQPDGRTAEEQRLFEKVEVKPQALEWIFSQAAGVSFQVSADNLAGETIILFRQYLNRLSYGVRKGCQSEQISLFKAWPANLLLNTARFYQHSAISVYPVKLKY